MRVTAITDVRAAADGLRVSGLLDSRGGGYRPTARPMAIRAATASRASQPRYAAQGDLTFRCNVDYRGAVTNVRIGRNQAAYNRGY